MVFSLAKNAWYTKLQEHTPDYVSGPSGIVTPPVPGHAVAQHGHTDRLAVQNNR
ncbi:unnamed protein product [Mycetohabitans rhizoxinica HKI 454]|uniref:Uncharacterized protein n=1 Tax=Mycetohabitans rhizoxinica (strain DSM 19002 / CIP 109453 / HKI 454) TaxID=882378 RepID=E5AQA7_MYCRK|nr:unnamed protein product [Mycetohabitans rhizoxinica HKI 454]